MTLIPSPRTTTTAADRALLLVPYQPSGRFSRWLVPCAVIACVLAVLLAWGYQQLLPLVSKERSFMFFVAISAGVFGTIVYVANWLSRSRSVAISGAAGIAAALCFLVTSQSLAGARAVRAGAPAGIVDNTRWRFTQGVQAPSSAGSARRAVSGWQLAVYWAIEATVFLALGGFAAICASREPFCERCGKRTSEEHWTRTAANVSRAGLNRMKTALTIGDLVAPEPERLAARGRPVVFTASACPGCGELVVFAVTAPRVGGMFAIGGGERELRADLLLDPESEQALLAGLDELEATAARQESNPASA